MINEWLLTMVYWIIMVANRVDNSTIITGQKFGAVQIINNCTWSHTEKSQVTDGSVELTLSV